jgi:hypothetical protein
MARRSEGWNVGRAHDLQDWKFAREFLSSVEEAFLFRSLSARWFGHGREGRCRWPARTFRVRSPPRHNLTQNTLNRLLRPLTLTLAPLEPSNWIHRSRPKRYRATMHPRAGSTR